MIAHIVCLFQDETDLTWWVIPSAIFECDVLLGAFFMK